VKRAYELMIIIEGDAEDGALDRILSRAGEMVTASDGVVKSTDKWGKRRFAYEINKKWEGVYVVLEIVTEASNLHDVERMLRIADEVVRHKLIRLPDDEAVKRGLFVGASA